jgi:hypothetical protein
MKIAERLRTRRSDGGCDLGVQPGHYFCSDSRLYRVEQLANGRALIEDCQTGDLIDAPVEQLLRLRQVRPSST